MSATDKPFACTSEGCQMTFTNEDHLNVHQKKHEMVLNLGLACKNNAFADQTPTPTRFIRNCEEVGLFQDLQNVNPFEETFRKAIEHSKNGMLHVPDASSDDTLHTPHIFPHITEEIADKFRQTTNDDHQPQEFSISNVPAINVDVIKISSKETRTNNKVKAEVADLTGNDYIEDVASEKEEITLVNSKYTVTNNCSIRKNSNTVGNFTSLKHARISKQLTDEVTVTKLHVKEKIKVALQNKQQEISLRPTRNNTDCDTPKPDGKSRISETVSVIVPKKPRKRVNLKSKLKKDDLYNKSKPTINFYDNNLGEVDKRRAMNRVAQMRSRLRKKVWLDQLENEISNLKANNRGLEVENQNLKDENILLKTILLNHNNCSLTSSDEIQILLSTQQTRQPKTDKGPIPIKPKEVQKNSLNPINLTTVINTQCPTSSTQTAPLPTIPTLLFTPFINTKRKLSTDKADKEVKLPKLLLKSNAVTTPSNIKIENDHLSASQFTAKTSYKKLFTNPTKIGVSDKSLNVACINVPAGFFVQLKSNENRTGVPK